MSEVWTCSCLTDDTRAWATTRCPFCKMERPNRGGITDAVESTREVMDALEAFKKLSVQYGEGQAMDQVLKVYGRRR